jgi:hypothetical protein
MSSPSDARETLCYERSSSGLIGYPGFNAGLCLILRLSIGLILTGAHLNPYVSWPDMCDFGREHKLPARNRWRVVQWLLKGEYA